MERDRSSSPVTLAYDRGVTPELAATLKKLPDRPGVYLMKDGRGVVLYVGKAQSLRSRVRSYWQKQAVGRRGPPDPERHRPGRRRRGTPMTDSVSRGAPARGQPGQALRAAVQRPAQGRQELPVHQDHDGRRLPADRADPQAAQGRQPLLRAVRLGDERRRVDEPDPSAVPVPDVHARHQGRQADPPAAVPAVPHQALPGPVHRGDLQGRLPGRHRPGRALPGRSPGDPGQGARGGDGRGRGTDRVRAGGGPPRQDPVDRADDGEPEDGGLRPDRARPGRDRPPGQPGGGPAVRRPRRQADRSGRLPARRRPRGARRRGPDRLPRAVLQPGHGDPQPDPRADRCPAPTTSPCSRGS